MNTDFRISVTCARHPKIRKLIRRLGYEAFFSLTCLWAFAAAHKPNGDLNGMDSEDIELAAEWSGEPGTFVIALIELRLLDVDDAGNMNIHDWRDHNGYAFYADARTAKAQKAASARWNKNSELMPADAQGNATSNAPSINEQCSEHDQALPVDAPSNAPSPAPTPAPTPAPYSIKDYCAEPAQAPPAAPEEAPPVQAEPAVLVFPLAKKGEEYPVTQKDVDEWQGSYPGIDVMQELRNCCQWNRDNPTRRKTKGGIRKHISGWLAREQNRGGGQSGRASPQQQPQQPRYPQRLSPNQAYMLELGRHLTEKKRNENRNDNPGIGRTPPALPGGGT